MTGLLLSQAKFKTLERIFALKQNLEPLNNASDSTMIVNLNSDLEKYQNFHPQFSFYFPSPLDNLRVKAIAKKALREGCPVDLVTQNLLEDSTFKQVTNKFGKQTSLKLASQTVKLALQQEVNQRR